MAALNHCGPNADLLSMTSLLPDDPGAASSDFESSAAAVLGFLRTELGLDMTLARDVDGEFTGALRSADPASAVEYPRVVGLLEDLLGSLLGQEHELASARREAARATLHASTDPLTGVRNRRHWEVVVTTEAERFRRYMNPYVIVVVDLDGVKEVNERQSHVAGDELIALTGVMLRACVRPSDTVARLGGDEFGILAVECNRDGASALTARLNDAFAAAGMRASMGVAVARPGRDGAATWAAATAAMFDSKATLGSLADTLERLGSAI